MKPEFMVERAETRVDMKVTAMLVGRHGRLGVEKAITENVSPRGVRVISGSEWYTDDTNPGLLADRSLYVCGSRCLL